jgi:hypothetical protein
VPRLLSVRAALLGAAVISPLLVIPAVSAASADSINAVPLLPSDPFAVRGSLTFRQSFALREVEARALADPAVYAQPYVDAAGTLHAPVTRADAMGAAAQPITVPPESEALDEGTDDPALMPPPSDAAPKGAPPAATAEAEPYALPKDATQPRIVTGSGTREYIPRARVCRARWPWGDLLTAPLGPGGAGRGVTGGVAVGWGRGEWRLGGPLGA